VYGLRRNVAALPPAIHPLRADLAHPQSWPALPEHIDDVIYAAAADRAEQAAYELAYVDGLSRVLDAVSAGRRAPRRVLFTSSTAVYAQRDGEIVDETSDTEPQHFSGKVMLRAEQLLLASGLPAVVLRLGGIYGPGRARMVDQLVSGALTLAASSTPTNRIHRDDCAGAICHLLTLPQPAPVYLGVDDEPASQHAIVSFLAQRLRLAVPAVAPTAASTRRGERTHKHCSNQRLRHSGYALRYPTYREGYGALADEYLSRRSDITQ
jgi:nucleoside-diphosphate-sugar epimerase